MLISRAVLIVLSLSVFTVRIHRQHVDVAVALKEMDSCLRVMRHASRHRSAMPFQEDGITTTDTI